MAVFEIGNLFGGTRGLSVDIDVIGDRQVTKNLAKFTAAMQRTIVANSAKDAMNRVVRPSIVRRLRSLRRTGKTTDPMIRYYSKKGSVIRIRRNRSEILGARIIMPPRDALGTDKASLLSKVSSGEVTEKQMRAAQRWYPPAHIELGSKGPRGRKEMPWMRPAINKNKAKLARIFRADLEKNIVKTANRINRRGGTRKGGFVEVKGLTL